MAPRNLTAQELATLAAELIRQAHTEQARHLTTEEFAARMHVSVRTVEGWRRRSYGPPWLPGRGTTGVRYREADIDAWEESRLKRPVTA